MPSIDEGTPPFGLAIAADGSPVQNTGCGEAPVLDRASLILTTDPVYYPGSADAINIQNCSRISIWADFTIGSLTNVIIRTYFMRTKINAVEFYMPLPLYTAGSRTVGIGKASHTVTQYTLTASGKVIIPIINPGAQWFRYSVEGTGTVTSSLLVLYHARSFLTHHVGEGIPVA